MQLNIQIGELAKSVEEYKGITLKNNCEVNIRDLGCKINTPTGSTYIHTIIKKEDLQGILITLENTIEIKCAKKHILRKNNKDIFAENLLIGDAIETINGDVRIVKIEDINDTIFYDIGIDKPYLYYDADGILHHNTIITAALSKLTEPYGRSVVIVPNRDLVTQTEDDYKNLGLDVGVFYSGRKEFNKTHTICTWQSLNFLDKQTAEKRKDDMALSDKEIDDFTRGVTTIIVDECHGAKADVLRRLLMDTFAHCPIRWGLTGTIPREDWEFLNILSAIGPVVNSLSAKELQDKDVLANCHVSVLQLQEVREFKKYHDEYKFLLTDSARLSFIADIINKISEDGNTLVLVQQIKAGEILTSNIPGSVFVNGSVKSTDRKEEYNAVGTENNKVIVATYGVASTGINIPRIFNLVLIEPGKSFVRTIQSIGRGLRRAQDKDFVQIWDFCASTKYSKKHLTERKKFYKNAQYPFNIERMRY